MTDPYALLAVAIYLYAGWAFADVTISSQYAGSPQRFTPPRWVILFGYAALLVAWPLLMPWIPRNPRYFSSKTGETK